MAAGRADLPAKQAPSLRKQVEDWGKPTSFGGSTSFDGVASSLKVLEKVRRRGHHVPDSQAARRHWADGANEQLSMSQQRRRYRHIRNAKTPTLSSAARDQQRFLDGQATEMRARSAPLDSLASSWSDLQLSSPSRGPSRAGLASRAGTLASRQGSRQVSWASARGGTADGSRGGNVLQGEIQRLQSQIRDIKTAVTDGFDDEFSSAARRGAAPWGLRTTSEAGARATEAAGTRRSTLSGAGSGIGGMDSVPPLADSSGMMGSSGGGFLSGQSIDVMLVDGFWAAASSGEEDSLPNLSSRAGTPSRGGGSRGSNGRSRPTTPLGLLLSEQTALGGGGTGVPPGRGRRDSTTGRPLQLPLNELANGRSSRRGSRDEVSLSRRGSASSRQDDLAQSRPGTRESQRSARSSKSPSRPGSREGQRSRPGSREGQVSQSPSRPGSRESLGRRGSGDILGGLGQGRPGSREKQQRMGSGGMQRQTKQRDTSLRKPGTALSRAKTPSQGTASDFRGLAARNEFFQIYKDEQGLRQEEGTEAPLLDSARHVYLSTCDAHNVMPLPLLIADPSRGDEEGCVNLDSYQLGDKVASAYTKGLVRMVQQGVKVEELDMSNNSLTGIGAQAVAQAVTRCPLLLVLNLSSNRIGNDGAEAIADALQSHPALSDLCLERNQLGDANASAILNGAAVHPSLTKLDLSDNLLGDRPGSMFGAAVEEFLGTNESVVYLDLSYNRIGTNRAAGEMLAKGLAENTTVKFLDLSMNALRDRGGCAIGSALRYNTGLTELDITENSIGEKGGMVIADALKENKILDTLTLNNNPVGPRGGRALFRAFKALVFMRRDCTIEIKGCNFSLSDPSKDKILSPNGVEEFDREEPGGTWTCDLSVPCERMVANELVDLAWVEEGENWMDETMDDKEFELPEPPPSETWTRDDYKLPEVGIMQVTYLSSKRAPKKSDAMDEATCNALQLLIERFAENPRRPVIQIQLHPHCREDKLIRDHFSQFGEVTHIEFVVYVDGEGWVPAGEHEEEEESAVATSAYVHFGQTKSAEKAMRMIDGDGDGELDKAGAFIGEIDLDPQWASELSTAPDKMEALLRLVGSEAFFTARQISNFVEMFTEDHWRIQVLSFLVHRCVDMENWNSEVMDFLNEEAFNALEDKLGQLFYFTPNNPTGHYKLQLHQPLQRIIMSKLVEISIDERVARRFDDDGDGEPDVVDTSQKGDWDNWRNEKIDYMDGEGVQEYDFDEKKPWDLPRDGMIDCDYVSTNVVFRLENVQPMESSFCDQLLNDIHVVWKSIHVGAKPSGTRGHYRRGSVDVAAAARTAIMGVDVGNDEEREMRKVARRSPWQIPNQTKHVYCSDADERMEMISQRVLLMLRRSTNECYYSDAHVRKIIALMPPKAKVEAMVTLFSRITDLENHAAHEILIEVDEYAKYRHRVGIANIFNPFRADVRYNLNLKVKDERAVAALLVEMTDEPGENWLNETFNGNPFEMGIAWVTDGPPTLGVLGLTFLTNPGTANLFMRTRMAKRLLMPGPGRWRAVPEELREAGQDGAELDEVCGNGAEITAGWGDGRTPPLGEEIQWANKEG